MSRLLAAIGFSLLLVGMQHHLVVHEIGHLGARLDRGSDATLHKTDAGSCVECALLAGGSNAAPLSDVGHGDLFQRAARPVELPELAPPLSWRAHYRSRAPPRSSV